MLEVNRIEAFVRCLCGTYKLGMVCNGCLLRLTWLTLLCPSYCEACSVTTFRRPVIMRDTREAGGGVFYCSTIRLHVRPSTARLTRVGVAIHQRKTQQILPIVAFLAWFRLFCCPLVVPSYHMLCRTCI